MIKCAHCVLVLGIYIQILNVGITPHVVRYLTCREQECQLSTTRELVMNEMQMHQNT